MCTGLLWLNGVSSWCSGPDGRPPSLSPALYKLWGWSGGRSRPGARDPPPGPTRTCILSVNFFRMHSSFVVGCSWVDGLIGVEVGFDCGKFGVWIRVVERFILFWRFQKRWLFFDIVKSAHKLFCSSSKVRLNRSKSSLIWMIQVSSISLKIYDVFDRLYLLWFFVDKNIVKICDTEIKMITWRGKWDEFWVFKVIIQILRLWFSDRTNRNQFF